MKYSISSVKAEYLPKLGWIAQIPKTAGPVKVFHGSQVEALANGIVEGCWDGDFQKGEFAHHANFFGSGICVEGERVIAASSLALTDRLVWLDSGSFYLCSNSLPLLLAGSNSRLDNDIDYAPIFSSTLKGIRNYDPTIPLAGNIPECSQVFGHNVEFSGDEVNRRYREPRALSLHDFGEYRQALTAVIARIVENCVDESRQTPVTLNTTLSTGYDSAAVTALLKDYELKNVFTTRPTPGDPSLEDGTPLAHKLGVNAFVLNRVTPAYQNELYSLAGTIDGRESIFEQALQAMEKEKVSTAIFTGYHGDKVWDFDTPKKYWHPDVLRGDTSGLNLCEVRLRAGFYNIGVPFIFATRIEELMRLSHSEEMKPWSIGGDYNRPLPRRFAEEAGLQRDSFGRQKKVVLSYEALPINERLRDDFKAYYKASFGSLKFYANEFLGNVDYAAKLAVNKLSLPFRFPQLKKRLKSRLVANQIYIFANNEIADEYREHLYTAFKGE